MLSEFERVYVRPKPGRVLIVGSRVYPGRTDRRLKHADAVGIDMLEGEGVDRVFDLENEVPDLGQFAHVECISVLEHSKQPWKLAENLVKLMEPEGTLFLTVPFCWRIHAYPNDYWRFSKAGVRLLFPSIKWSAMCYANNRLCDEVRGLNIDGLPYFPRTEVFAFGMLV